MKNKIAQKQKSYRKGLWAETLASLYLAINGYKILARRFKCKSGEIDVIAKRGRVIAFVEVKARSTKTSALESVTPRNRLRIERTAQMFLSRNTRYADFDLRFDVITFSPPFLLSHLDNAWQARS